jgi:very-short-patch-repair endonuclease
VGDDKQTSPANVGLNQQLVFDLIESHLRGIKDAVALFNSQNSLYDISHHKFPDLVVLSEHFRSLPAIIGFSNARYYGGNMVPLRDRPPSPGWQSVGTVFVPDGFRDGRDVNEPEALVTADLIEEMCDDPAYESMTFGVVTLLGGAQALRIQELLLDRLGPEVMEERQIRCGQAPAFQGDERDVVILSLVADKSEGRRIAPMTSGQAEQALNVAATRAKNQMWVVHSLEAEDFPKDDPRAALIRHCQDPTSLEVAYSNLEDRCDSQFERDVLRRVLAKGFSRVRAQHAVGGYRIDIVIEGPESRLAVECDGDAWHGEDAWESDRVRQLKLERAGWTFERIRGSAFYRDPDRALGPLWTRLDELGIPTGDWAGDVVHAPQGNRRVAKTMAERRASPPTARPIRRLGGLDIVRGSSDIISISTPMEDDLSAPASDPLSAAQADLEMLPSRDPGTPLPGSRAMVLAPYQEWEPRPLSSAADGADDRVLTDLIEIVGVEGPIQALRLYQLHARAAGGHRVGREMRHRYNSLVSRAIRRGALAQVEDDIPGVIDKALYSPGSPEVVLRSLGPRQLVEVPRSEVATLARELRGADVNATKRAVLDAMGLIRMRQR